MGAGRDEGVERVGWGISEAEVRGVSRSAKPGKSGDSFV